MKIEFLSITELANRWNVSRERVKAMVNHGILPGAVVIPSAGRFGKAVKIPLWEVMELEAEWQVESKSPEASARDELHSPSHLVLSTFGTAY